MPLLVVLVVLVVPVVLVVLVVLLPVPVLLSAASRSTGMQEGAFTFAPPWWLLLLLLLLLLHSAHSRACSPSSSIQDKPRRYAASACAAMELPFWKYAA